MTARRLPRGGRIDRTTTLPFTWDGRPLHGHPGDTVASALLANDIMLVGRSFKYHRPRGIMTAGVEESGALLTIGHGPHRDPNVKATTQELYAGLAARGQNAWPSVRFDTGQVADCLSRFLPAGFYYKTFMGPRLKLGSAVWGGGTGAWMWFEQFIRRAAGMGTASRQPDPDHYEHAHAFCDVLVVGAGPAGLAAAASTARAGLDVLLVEQDHELGGTLLSQPEHQSVLAELLVEARAAGVREMNRTTAFGLYDDGVAGLLERVTDHLAPKNEATTTTTIIALPRQRCWTVRATHTIIATGAIERHLGFGDNDRPGVMGMAAAGTYLHRYGILLGERIVAATNNDSAYPVAAALAEAGAKVTLLDARTEIAPPQHQLAEQAGVAVHFGHAPLRALGQRRVRGLAVAVADGAGWKPGPRHPCDLILASAGWSPTIHLPAHRGAKSVWQPQLACFLAEGGDPACNIAGAAAGLWPLQACIDSGRATATTATRPLTKPTAPTKATAPPQTGGWNTPIRPLHEVRVPGHNLKTLVDLQNDVTSADIRLAHREGFVSVEHLKRYTTLGMATDGGKVGNVMGVALMAEARGIEVAQAGLTGFRPPYTPVTLGALRGRSVGPHFRPLRRTPMHQWNLDHGAVMTMAGLWHRPWYYSRGGPRAPPHAPETLTQAYIREATTVRTSVGLCDVTSLGKIALQGPDTARLLDRLYVNPFAKLPVGRARYGVMLRDDGMVLDDGTTWRLSETDYFMTTTTAHAAKVMAWLEELLQTRWPSLRVAVTSVSEQWAGCAVAGPHSRSVLTACVDTPALLHPDSLPFMGVAEATLHGGIPCRIARISFSGELAYEVYVPSDWAVAMMELLWQAAEAAGGCLYGLEAMGTLRIEKGHVTGAELDGRVTLEDAGLGRMASPNKSFIGSSLRARPDLHHPHRPRLTAIKPCRDGDTFNAGAILCRPEHGGRHSTGWVTAVTHSPALGHWLGLGFIAGGFEAWQGQTAIAADPVRGREVEVVLIDPHTFDPKGERMHG